MADAPGLCADEWPGDGGSALTRQSQRWLLLFALVLLAGARLSREVPRVLPQPEPPAAHAMLADSARDHAQQSFGMALRNADPAAALRTAAMHRGGDDSEFERVRALIDQACRAPTLLRLEGRNDADPRRDPARRALEARCARMPQPSLYVPTAETDSPLSQEQSASADPTAALVALRGARDRRTLIDAWTRAYRSGALPQEEIFADRRRLLPGEAEAVILAVANWRECARLDACAADSLLTLEVCALYGCPPGADLRQAYHEALSPRDFESVEQVHAWLLRWQAPSPP